MSEVPRVRRKGGKDAAKLVEPQSKIKILVRHREEQNTELPQFLASGTAHTSSQTLPPCGLWGRNLKGDSHLVKMSSRAREKQASAEKAPWMPSSISECTCNTKH